MLSDIVFHTTIKWLGIKRISQEKIVFNFFLLLVSLIVTHFSIRFLYIVLIIYKNKLKEKRKKNKS
jgi:hypothetical protein